MRTTFRMKEVCERWLRNLLCAGVYLASIVALAAPTISDVKVTSVEPLGVAIDFTVSDVTEEDAVKVLDMSMIANGTNYVAQTLSGATNCVNGAHRVYWNMAKDGLSIDPATASLTVAYNYPRYCVIDLSGGANATSYPVAYMNVEPKGGFNTAEYKMMKLVMKRVDAGSFIMGEDQKNEDHRVMLTKPFYMGLYEVTQRQWELVTGLNPCSSTKYGKGDAYPVHYVSYNMIRGSSSGAKWPSLNAVDADSFLGKLRAKTGNLLFDLPTAAQWEYACRAGTTTTYSYGDSADGAYMWYSSNSSSKAHEVGTKLPNKWGFYDMHGNVWEWCLDWYGSLVYGTDPKGSSSGSYRVLRGGSWHDIASYCTSSRRDGLYPSNSYFSYGFRLSRTVSSLDETGVMSATVESALGRIYADGSSVDGKMSLGYAPTESGNAVVTVNDDVMLNASEAGSWTWTAMTAGVYAVSHAVVGEAMSASYVVTNGYAVAIENGKDSFRIPISWFAQYPTLGGTTVAEWQKVAEGNGVKSAPVWHDYVAGTDPTNATSHFTAKVEMRGGAPAVTWSPALNGEGVREGARVYRVWGKANLDDAAWREVSAGGEGDYRFFRVTVEMP